MAARAAISVHAVGQIRGASVPDIVAVVADTAVLVADGASPTQAHVTTLNGHVATLSPVTAGDLAVVWDPATITTVNQLKAAFAVVLAAAQGGYGGLS